MAVYLHEEDLPAGVLAPGPIAIDTETMGLNPARDRLCLVQLSSGDGNAHLVQIGKGQTVAEFEAALFALGAGELCPEPVRTRFGVHVIRAGRRAEGQQLPFEAVEATIRDYLEEASTRKAVAQYLSILAPPAPR